MTLLLVAVLAFCLAGFAQSVSGFGAALVAVPVLALVTDPLTTVVSVTLISGVLTGAAAVRERAHVDRGVALRLVVSGLVGLPLGLVLLARAPAAAVEVLMAVVVLAALIVVVRPLRVALGAVAVAGCGVLSGALLTATGMNGPPLVLAVSATGTPRRRFRGTLQVVLCAQDLAALIGFVLVGWLEPEAFRVAAVGLVASPLGWWAGDRVFDRIDEQVFRRVLIAGLTGCALALVARHLL